MKTNNKQPTEQQEENTMMKRLISESHKNMTVTADELNGMYLVRAFMNGKLYDSYETANKSEAQEVYSNTVYAMYK